MCGLGLNQPGLTFPPTCPPRLGLGPELLTGQRRAPWPAARLRHCRYEVVAVNAKDMLGRQGEELAAGFLARAGLTIVARNWRCGQGEIDIVAVDGRTLVICEVKTRSGVTFGTPLEAVTRQKAYRLRRLAALYLRDHQVLYDEVRIDVVGVLRSPAGEFTIEHVRGVG